jgi:rhodanese-related sulfurtransferase
MQENQRYHKKRNSNKNLSLKPIAIGALLIIVVVGIYFSKNFLFTKDKEKIIDEVIQEKSEKITVPMILSEDLQKLVYKDTHQIIDIRSAEEFEYSHVESSKNIPIAKLKEQANKLDKNIPIIIIDQIETTQGKEATQYLEELGFSSRYLIGGITSFSKEGFSIISFGDPNLTTDIIKVNPISSEEANQKAINEPRLIKFLDVRSRKDFERNHIQNATNIPLEELEKNKRDIPVGKIIIVDEEPIRSFRSAVRLHDMNFIKVYYLESSLSEFKKYIEESAENTEKIKESG